MDGSPLHCLKYAGNALLIEFAVFFAKPININSVTQALLINVSALMTVTKWCHLLFWFISRHQLSVITGNCASSSLLPFLPAITLLQLTP